MSFFLPVAPGQLQHGQLQYFFQDMLFDFSHQMIGESQLACLVARASGKGVGEAMAALEQGIFLNDTEQRIVSHPLLRQVAGGQLPGKLDLDVAHQVKAVYAQMAQFVDDILLQRRLTVKDQPFRHVVCVGVGGSDLGLRLVIEALYHLRLPGLQIHHVSNLDGADLREILDEVDAASTLFCISSKSFGTSETLNNFQAVRSWACRQLDCAEDEFMRCQVVALTAAPDKALAMGIPAENIFPLWDWVGGRFSLWSAIGLPIALALGMPAFQELLQGAADMDAHFFSTDLHENIPVLMALIGIWNIEQFDAVGLSIAPYSHRLRSLSRYLQQLEMESNGKRLKKDGTYVASHTAPIVFGDAGTNGQHAYFQMLHQGTRHIPTDFIAVVEDAEAFPGHHDQLLANCFAQSEALAEGRIDPEQPHKSCAGGQRSTTILLPELSPYYLGALLAAYEHKVFVQGVMWDINSFDQWGVELGKKIARNIHHAMQNPEARSQLNPVTRNLIEHVEKIRQKKRIAP